MAGARVHANAKRAAAHQRTDCETGALALELRRHHPDQHVGRRLQLLLRKPRCGARTGLGRRLRALSVTPSGLFGEVLQRRFSLRSRRSTQVRYRCDSSGRSPGSPINQASGLSRRTRDISRM